jgi:hypothetical protein
VIRRRGINRNEIYFRKQLKMSNDFFYDAINLFKYSPTGQGRPNIGGPAAHQNRYRQLAGEVTEKLWNLWATDEIGFGSLPQNVAASSQARRRASDIIVDYQYQNNLPVTSFLLVHEAVHLVRPWQYVIEDILCRNLQYSYFIDLQGGRSFHSRNNNGQLMFVQLTTANTPPWAQSEHRFFLNGQIVDYVISMDEYATSLTADFVRQSIEWWGGPSNRWMTTLGRYLRSLAADNNPANAGIMVRILEAVDRSNCDEWRRMERAVGPLDQRAGHWDRIRARLASAGSTDRALAARIGVVEEYWGVNLGGFATNPRTRRCPAS